MGVAEAIAWAAARAAHELALFAAVGLALGGIDDVVVDAVWIARTMWRRLTVYRRYSRADAVSLVRSDAGPIAVFVPAWRECEVIGRMATTALTRWAAEDIRLYVGCYPNDPTTIREVERLLAQDDRLRLVINSRPGPTTKADNLNAMWRALLAEEQNQARRFAAVVLHDAEDVVHPDEIAVFSALSPRFDLVQLPVFALIETQNGLWCRVISAVAADEFAETNWTLSAVRCCSDRQAAIVPFQRLPEKAQPVAVARLSTSSMCRTTSS